MSTSKRIDKICVVVCLLSLFLTGLFMNGEALGLTPVADGDAGNGQFTENDRNADWDRSSATRITLTGDGGSVKGSGAYVNDGDVHILYAGTYILSGELTNGSIIVEAGNSDKIWILLDGVSLHCDDSAAFLVEQAGKVFLTLADGTENSISSGAEYGQESVSAGIDGAIYSRDDLTINGSGSLCVTAAYKHGIVCNDDLVIVGGTLEVTAPQDGIHANDSARLANAELTINAGDDGITVSNDTETGYVYVESGSISIPSCYEGIEAVDITIAGGTLDIRPIDDGINANGRGSSSVIHISGGDITIINETGRDADGLDSNGSIDISGGNVFISVNGSGTNAAIDYGSENGGVCTISGGTVIAAGSSTMAEGFDSSSEQCFIMYTTSNASAGTTVTLKNEGGSVLLSETIPCSFSSIVISTPKLQMGETCTISVGSTEDEIVVDNSSSGGFAMAGMFGGGMQHGGMFGGRGGGKGDRNFSNHSDAENTDTENTPPEMPDKDAQRGEMQGGQMPQGGGAPQDDFAPGGVQGGGDMPDMNDVPNIPDFGDMNGDVPPDGFQVPEGSSDRQNGGNIQRESSSPEAASGDTQFPDQMRGQNGMGGGNRGDGSQFMPWGQNEDRLQDAAASGTSTVSPDTLALVGVSILFLLAGILVALKVKH